MKIDNSPPRGTRDLLPDSVAVRDHVLARISEVYHRYGYHRIETPALEDIRRLQGGDGGENEKLIFQVLKRGLGEQVEDGARVADLIDLGLRFDLTVPLVRFYANNHATLPSPFRAFQFAPVWRAERPQKGRYRQFYQCDIDLIGDGSVLAEVELIEATTEALDAIGITGTTVRLSDRRFLSALAAHVGLAEPEWAGFFIGLDKLDKIGWQGVRAELVDKRGLSASAVDNAQSIIEGLIGPAADKVADRLAEAVPTLPDEVVAEMATTVGCLADLGTGRPVRWEFDPTLVRGMGYYTGQIFEISHPESSSSVAGGGRYDKLVGRSLGKDIPACGFSLGFERIIDLIPDAPARSALAVLFEPEVPISYALERARQARAEGRETTVIRRSGKLPAQLNRVEGQGFTGFVHLRAVSTDGTVEPERPLGVVK
ncbi:histidine--tRNA ligase [Actinosynnema sp. NPDC047251]|uniref:Histidine--tRNA ligase n=1 Tax=Saccharothrix espanaensis (strain ATCC 51144 / DSM 44229 / JCM 9112 / NBRC 15066 / NRRL 15764) TaxID=1179773 RepID=K0JNY8_SACES|nr:histidine--tRNA ligase [Saccharothrix espanaensis]CCH28010.1 Histidyl-tRNA synthetase [Saccharothrix espanaensis DSM 44229]